MDRDKERNRDRVTGRDVQGQKDMDKEIGDRDEERDRDREIGTGTEEQGEGHK